MTIKVSAIEGNRQKLDGGSMFGNAPRPMWETWLKPDQENRVELACRGLLIETEEQKILCETGIGAFLEPKLAQRYGVQTPGDHLLLKNLAKKGLREEDITHVVLSHLHFDHAGGLLPPYSEILNGDQRILFPNAQYIVGSTAFSRAENPHMRDKASFIPGLTQKLRESQSLILIEENQTQHPLDHLITFIFSHGHTPGQMHSLIKGKTNSVFFCGDLIPGSSWLHLPITMGYDRFPEQLIDEKVALYDQATLEQWLLFYTHDPELCVSTCYKDQKGKIKPSNVLAELQDLAI